MDTIYRVILPVKYEGLIFEKQSKYLHMNKGTSHFWVNILQISKIFHYQCQSVFYIYSAVPWFLVTHKKLSDT